MAHLAGHDRSQLLLLPGAVDDYVGPNNPVRFIEAFVDALDLAGAGFARVVPKAMGRPGYDPADLLTLYIYGYLNRVRSSRWPAPIWWPGSNLMHSGLCAYADRIELRQEGRVVCEHVRAFGWAEKSTISGNTFRC
jgi:hypothetical protein